MCFFLVKPLLYSVKYLHINLKTSEIRLSSWKMFGAMSLQVHSFIFLRKPNLLLSQNFSSILRHYSLVNKNVYARLPDVFSLYTFVRIFLNHTGNCDNQVLVFFP